LTRNKRFAFQPKAGGPSPPLRVKDYLALPIVPELPEVVPAAVAIEVLGGTGGGGGKGRGTRGGERGGWVAH